MSARLDPLTALLLFARSLVVYWLTLTPSLSLKSCQGNELASVAYRLALARVLATPCTAG